MIAHILTSARYARILLETADEAGSHDVSGLSDCPSRQQAFDAVDRDRGIEDAPVDRDVELFAIAAACGRPKLQGVVDFDFGR